MKPTSPRYFETFLSQCWKEGNRSGRHLFHNVKQRGYTGSFANLERLLGAWRRSEREQADDIPPTKWNLEPIRDPETGHAISPVIAAAPCIKPRGMLTDRQARKVNALKQGSNAFAEMRRLAMRFNGILRSKKSEALDAWIDDAIDSRLISLMRFARVLRRFCRRRQASSALPTAPGVDRALLTSSRGPHSERRVKKNNVGILVGRFTRRFPVDLTDEDLKTAGSN